MTVYIAVIVPYFQTRPGILARALNSVAEQTGLTGEAVEVVVVDDASPNPPEAEIAPFEDRLSIRLVRRTNGGPGAARNTGLSSLSPEIRFVAFLDSDDIWADDHLSRAIETLRSSEASFFFSNFTQLGADVPAFERAGRLVPAEHLRIGQDVYVYRGNMGAQILAGNLIGTSTVVFSFERHPDLRFHTDYRRAGEDYLMWLDFWKRGATFAFRTAPSVVYGDGVNVFSGASWGSVALLERTRDEIRFLRVALDTYELPDAVSASVSSRIAERKRHYLRALVAALRRSPLNVIRHLAKC